MLRVSIIIPTWNEQSAIRATVRSICELNPHEVIVADGGSTDDTVQIAEELGCEIVASPPGRGGQQNAGAAHATGDVFLFLHADCRLPRNGLAQIERVVGEPGFACGAFDQRIDADGFVYRLLEWGNGFRARYLHGPYGDQGIFVKRDAFRAVGGFPDVPLMEDVGLVRRLRKRGRVIVSDGPLTVSARRWQQYGVVRQTLRNWTLLLGARFGVSPERLAKWYPRPGE